VLTHEVDAADAGDPPSVHQLDRPLPGEEASQQEESAAGEALICSTAVPFGTADIGDHLLLCSEQACSIQRSVVLWFPTDYNAMSMQVGVTAMLIASKYEEIWAPELRDFIYISDKAYTREQILAMEKLMLNTLNFSLTVPTAYNFLGRLLKVGQPGQIYLQVTYDAILLSYALHSQKVLESACLP
jgi:hypothetical protein